MFALIASQTNLQGLGLEGYIFGGIVAALALLLLVVAEVQNWRYGEPRITSLRRRRSTR